MVILPGIRVIVRRFLCIERRFLSNSSKKFYVHVLAQCAVRAAAVAVVPLIYIRINSNYSQNLAYNIITKWKLIRDI